MTDNKFSLRRAAEFLQNILSLERQVRRLKEENEQLRQEVKLLQQTVDDHNGQLKVILSILDSGINNRIEAAAEKAAIETMVRLLEDGSKD